MSSNFVPGTGFLPRRPLSQTSLTTRFRWGLAFGAHKPAKISQHKVFSPDSLKSLLCCCEKNAVWNLAQNCRLWIIYFSGRGNLFTASLQINIRYIKQVNKIKQPNNRKPGNRTGTAGTEPTRTEPQLNRIVFCAAVPAS